MSEKRFYIAKLIACTVLAAVMVIGLAMPAFAANYSSGESSKDPAKAAITKIFKMPIGTVTPEANFIFTFEKVGMNDPLNESAEALAGMPDIKDVVIDFGAGEEPAGGLLVAGDAKILVKQSDDFLAGMTGGVWKNGEGIYKYRVYEDRTPVGGSSIAIADASKEKGTYSNAVYDVEIWVEKDADGILYAKYVCVKIVAGSEDEYYVTDGVAASGKVDPTPGAEELFPGAPADFSNKFSKVIFTNKYWKTDGGGTTDPGVTALEIVKKITGNGAALDAYFSFDVKVKQSGVIPAVQQYKAYVLDAGDKNVTSAANYPTLEADGSILFTSGVTLKGIKLTNGQRLAFVDLHVGSAVEVTEAAAEGYIPSYQRTFAGTGEYKGILNTALGFPGREDPGPHYTVGGHGENIVTFTNTRSGATPTGISVDNLPYIVLIGLAIAALAIYTVIRLYKGSKHAA